MSHVDYQLSTGCVIGRDHRLASRNYQDASSVLRTGAMTVTVVADGCGSGGFSEVGASLGVRLLGEALVRQNPDAIDWAGVQQDVLSAISVLVRQMGGSFARTVQEYFLFTLVGCVLGGERAVFFALGDGMIVVNGVPTTLGPFAGNAPPYLGYALLSGRLTADPGPLKLQPVCELPLSDLDSFMVGSDGLHDLAAAAELNLPGGTEPCGPLSQYWENDRYFGTNRDLLSRRLRLIGRDWPKVDPDPGRLPDDTTMVVGRRIPAA